MTQLSELLVDLDTNTAANDRLFMNVGRDDLCDAMTDGPIELDCMLVTGTIL